jgi:hypothetical protein
MDEREKRFRILAQRWAFQMKVTPSISSYIRFKGGEIKDISFLFWISSKG